MFNFSSIPIAEEGFKLKEMEYVEKIADKIGEITVTGNGQVIDQLKSIFVNGK